VKTLDPIALQRAQEIGISKFLPQLLQDPPVSVTRLPAERTRQVFAQILLDLVIVQEGVIYVEKEYEWTASFRVHNKPLTREQSDNLSEHCSNGKRTNAAEGRYRIPR
jgi:hypothetical protein